MTQDMTSIVLPHPNLPRLVLSNPISSEDSILFSTMDFDQHFVVESINPKDTIHTYGSKKFDSQTTGNSNKNNNMTAATAELKISLSTWNLTHIYRLVNESVYIAHCQHRLADDNDNDDVTKQVRSQTSAKTAG
jgi:hypothetical protein